MKCVVLNMLCFLRPIGGVGLSNPANRQAPLFDRKAAKTLAWYRGNYDNDIRIISVTRNTCCDKRLISYQETRPTHLSTQVFIITNAHHILRVLLSAA